MKKPDIWKVVATCLLPDEAKLSPCDWDNYIEIYLIPEVKMETQRFYGETTSAEALHPGLDYASTGHRSRLEAFYWHRKLFAAFDKLRLTEDEIRALCQWEGTLAAKNLFEGETKFQIMDTTWNGVLPYHKKPPIAYVLPMRPTQRGGSVTPTTAYELSNNQTVAGEDEESRVSERGSEDAVQETGEVVQRRHVMDLNQQIMVAEWEQWMKEALERGDISSTPESSHFRALQNLARLRDESQGQVAHSIPSAASSHRSSLSSNQVDQHQIQIDSPTHTLNNNASVAHSSPSPSLRPNHTYHQPREVIQRVRPFSFDSQRSARLLLASSNDNAHPPRSSAATGHLLDHGSTSRAIFWGREADEIFSDYSRSHIAALQDSISHSAGYTQFYPSARAVSAATRSSGPAVPSPMRSASVPS